MSHWTYLKLYLTHKWLVFLWCVRLGVPWRGILHDISKLLPSEWIPLSRRFGGGGGDIADVDRAHVLHRNRNGHMYQHWCLKEDDGKWVFLEIPEPYLKEMIADWIVKAGSPRQALDWILSHEDVWVSINGKSLTSIIRHLLVLSYE